ncbi:TetR/AcrR family transcriptional regulator [Mycobacterium sp. IDR2000157661]|uniref:TetR/AcrR family transcriptional regulator n=1 Tax=Mycobacterium sp. IDR2000157661 TaxID=2867005 RepID=UPI001EEA4D24|nr:helix-turn-helix domain-containing protein [Mycobacterium sp. IDR2000157661]ULE31436.1 TetR/AcrR family transcriptional regulator [Mycobacterium sp. IDR2000157661]
MGRPRGFDEPAVINAAARLFARRGFSGVSVDDLVRDLGVHRNSLYRTFGSKRGLYLAALRTIRSGCLAAIAAAADPVAAAGDAALSTDIGGLDLLLMAAAEQAAQDEEVAAEVSAALAELDAITAPMGDGPLATATLLGLRIRVRSGGDCAGLVSTWSQQAATTRWNEGG